MGGDWPITVNITDETIEQWETLIDAYYSRTNNSLQMWFEVWSPYLTKAYYIIAEPPKNIPMSEMGQNALQTVEITLSVNDYKGLDTAIEPTASTSGGSGA